MNADTFKDHVAKYEKHSDHLETLEWKEPGSSIYAIWYVRQYGTLMVFGDCYEAIYQWYPDMSFRSMADTNLDYFVSKCKASPHGRKPEIWDSAAAHTCLKEYFGQTSGGMDEDDLAMLKKQEEEFEDLSGWRYLDSEFEWNHWAYDNASDVFGSDWYEDISLARPGMILDPCIRLHHAGLKAAFEQLAQKEEGKEKEIVTT